MKTLKEFGAIASQARMDCRPEIDATAALQSAANEGGVVLVDNYYFISGTIAITKPFQIILEGNPGHIYPGNQHGNNTWTNPYQAGLGCLYAAPNSRDMFHIFTSGFHCSGGLIDLRNCVYSGAQPYYTQPAVFRYCYWKNLIMSGSLDVEIAGNKTEAMKFNGGHIGVFFDGSSSNLPNDPASYPYGFCEMHFCKFNVRGNFLYAPVFSTDDEPYQDYSAVMSHPSLGACSAIASSDVSGFIADSPASYLVAQNTLRILAIRWGKSSIINLKLNYRSGSYVDLINRELKANGIEQFTAIALPSGTNQSFRLVGSIPFSFRCYRPNTCNLHDYNIVSNGCKTVQIGRPGDISKVRARFQTFPMLAKSGNPSGVLDDELSEWSVPCYTIEGSGNQLDLYYVDLNKGNNATHKANPTAIINRGTNNEAVGSTLAAIENNHVIETVSFVNSKQLIRNHRFFNQTNWQSSTGRDGFVSDLDDCLYLADQRFANSWKFKRDGVELPLGSVSYPQNLHRYNALAMSVNYTADFGLTDVVEYQLSFAGQLEIVAIYLLLDSTNRPNSVDIISQGSSSTFSQNFDLSLLRGNLLSVDGLNTNNTQTLTVRFKGIQDKTKPFTIKRLAAKNRHATQSAKPFIDIQGGQKIHGDIDMKSMKINGRTIQPIAAGTPTTIQELTDKLKQSGIFF